MKVKKIRLFIGLVVFWVKGQLALRVGKSFLNLAE
jgi:hypothetical protein